MVTETRKENGRHAAGPDVDVNYRYFVHFIKQLPEWRSLKVLDFGCGEGEIVRLLRQEGVDCCGADVFYGGGTYERLSESDLFRRGIIRAIQETGELPFEPRSFDVVISNQVLEHVRYPAAVLSRLDAVLKDEGLMYHHFPSREVIREGHIGIPFVHWLPSGSLRYAYARLMRVAGLGYFKQGLPPGEWARRRLDWLDRYCFYRKRRDLEAMLGRRYVVAHREIDYCRFRAGARPLLRLLLGIRVLRPLYERLFQRLAFMAIELRRREPHAPTSRA